MSSFGDVLRGRVLPGLGAFPDDQGGMQALLMKASYRPSSDNNSRDLLINQVSSDSFIRGLTHDFERFALSSRESYLSAASENSDSVYLGWPLLKFYYSCFFAAHALMRSRGCGVFKLDSDHVKHLNEVAEVYDSNAPRLSPGMHIFKLSDVRTGSRNEYSFLISEDAKGSGVHEGFWLNFCRFLNEEAAQNVTSGMAEAGPFLALTDSLVGAIRDGSRSRVWLSSIRNELNYQHKYDAWLPYRRSSEAYKALSKINAMEAESFRLDISKSKKPIEAFLNVAGYISQAAFSVCEEVASRSRRGGCFGAKWQKTNNITR